jgi:thiamine biosynthesis lipoprotein
MKKYRYLAPAIIVLAILGITLAKNLRGDLAFYSDSVLMMDTLVEVSVWGKGRVSPEAGADSALAVLARIDRLLGDAFVDTGKDKKVLQSPEFRDILTVSEEVYALSGGLFDPTIGSVSRLWSFGEDARIPEPDSLRQALASVGLARFLAAPDSSRFILDLGGVAKGYAVDLAAAELVDLGFKSAIVSAGGDMRLVGRRPDGKPWRIAIRHPRREGDFIGYLDLMDVAVTTSGDYERCFMLDGKRYHHILDPGTGMPGRASTSVTVVAKNTAICDALATGLFLMGPREGLELAESLDDVDAVFVYADGESLAVTSGLKGKFERARVE